VHPCRRPRNILLRLLRAAMILSRPPLSGTSIASFIHLFDETLSGAGAGSIQGLLAGLRTSSRTTLVIIELGGFGNTVAKCVPLAVPLGLEECLSATLLDLCQHPRLVCADGGALGF
jgi:hypothetical protein